MPTKALPSAEELRQLLTYEPETGKLLWKPRPREMFGSQRAFSTWNARFAGREAFTARLADGRRHGKIYGKSYVAHRVAWCMHLGRWPSQHIDHINGDPADNRIVNLRDVSQAENARNQRRRKNNTSGCMGVYWGSKEGKWRAKITQDGRTRHLGLFRCLTAAVAARKSAECEFGFHKNHGRTA